MDIAKCVPIYDDSGVCVGVNAGSDSWSLSQPQQTAFVAELLAAGKSWDQWLAARDKIRQRDAIQSQLAASDLAYIRTTDDLIDLLITKNFLAESELPAAVRTKRATRAALREQLKAL